MVTRYKTINATSEGFYKEKGSKFLAFALPVATEDEIQTALQQVRKKYHDARHHCYAYILGIEGKHTRANDDGEPNHSAGDPILGQIRSFGLTNTLVVVVRYFGGTKLGVSGLINAYKTATRAALDKATIITVPVTKPITLTFPYAATNEAMKLVADFNITIVDQQFDISCQINGNVPVDQAEPLIEKVALLQSLGTELKLKI